MGRPGSRSANGRSPAAARGARQRAHGVRTGRAAAGPARRDPRRRDQPRPRADDQDGPRHPPQGRRPAHRARLRSGRALAHRAEAQERRPLHHPPARRGHDPGRAGHEQRDAVRGPAARHGRGHRLHPRPAAGRLRRRDRRPGRRRDQAGQGQVRRGRRGRDRAQDGRGHVPGHPGPGHQARRPAAQHAHAALPAAGEAGAQVARDAGDLRAAGPPARHEHHQVGTRGPGLRDAVPQAVRRDRPAGLRARPGPRRLPPGGHRGRRRPTCARPRSRRGSPAAPSTTTPSTRR